MLRRMLAISLMIAFGSPLLLPLFAATADPEASLPACCRTHGAHRCAMMHRPVVGSEGPAFQAPPCAEYPAATTPVRTASASLSTPQQFAVEPVRTPALAVLSLRAARLFVLSANLNRGPPHHSA
ncbi:MAG TPA: hypothetical protein VGN01_12900 [Acidobacteriaceae bacterium]